MYSKHPVVIPQIPGKIVLLKNGNDKYVYFQTERIYNPDKKYTMPKRISIGKVVLSDDSMMFPNERFFRFFPEIPYHDEESEPTRSYAIKAGCYILFRKIIDELQLEEILKAQFEQEDINLFLDLAAYSIVTGNNAGQYYPMYAYEHALFTTDMTVYSASQIASWMRSVTQTQITGTLNKWNEVRNHEDRVYISYDSTSKNPQAGDSEFVEFEEAEGNQRMPIVNYSLAYDCTDKLPLFYESYPGSIPDIAQFICMVEKAHSYGYRNVGFILERGCLSKENIQYLDDCGCDFIFMVEGCDKLINSIVFEKLYSFEKKSQYYIEEYDLSGCTVEKNSSTMTGPDTFIYIIAQLKKQQRCSRLTRICER